MLAQTCHEWHDVVTPYLYHTVRFHSTGRIAVNDPLQMKLEIFGDPRFTKLVHTQRVFITGSWYNAYNEIDSELGYSRILSPAARMLNNIIASCIMRMPNLKEFTYFPRFFLLSLIVITLYFHGLYIDRWDLPVSATQHLVTAVMLMPNLEALQLRLGTDSTPSPYFHPSLDFRPPINVRTLTLIEIDDKSVLQSLGSALQSATCLRELTMWAVGDSLLRLSDAFVNWSGQAPFELTTLDLRGFYEVGEPMCDLWDFISPMKLKTLTLHVHPKSDISACADFWRSSVTAGLRPQKLSTNLLAHGMKDFILSFSGLEVFNISLPNATSPPEPLPVLLSALRKQHSATLKVLSADPQDTLSSHLLDGELLNILMTHFTNIEELQLGVDQTVQVELPFIIHSPFSTFMNFF